MAAIAERARQVRLKACGPFAQRCDYVGETDKWNSCEWHEGTHPADDTERLLDALRTSRTEAKTLAEAVRAALADPEGHLGPLRDALAACDANSVSGQPG